MYKLNHQPFNIGSKHSVNIEKLVYGGDGIAKINNFAIFIPYVCDNENVEFYIAERKKSYARGVVENIITGSSDRITPRCQHYFSCKNTTTYCGGCNWQHINYQSQVEHKQNIFNEMLSFLNTNKLKILAPIPATEPWNYRNRTHLVFGLNYQGKTALGFYVPNSHKMINILHCVTQPELVDNIIPKIENVINGLNILPYNEEYHSGVLRHLSVRYSYFEDKLMLIFITRTQNLPSIKSFTSKITDCSAKIVGIYHNINPVKTNVIFGDTTSLVYGVDHLTEAIRHPILGKLKFYISPLSFYQVNTFQTPLLYQTIYELSDPKHDDVLIDLYSGSGGISLYLAPYVKQIYGVDSSSDSITCAISNLRMNKIANVQSLCEKSESLTKLLHTTSNMSVILDPPRAGCSDDVINQISVIKPKKIVYVSCNPSTLVRDLKKLLSLSYNITQSRIVDMFPQTSHIETVTILTS